MFCLEHFSLTCVIKIVKLKVNDPHMCLSAWFKHIWGYVPFVFDDLCNPVVCFKPPSLLFGKGLGTCDAPLCLVPYNVKCIVEWVGG